MIYYGKVTHLDNSCENIADFLINQNNISCFIGFSQLDLVLNRAYEIEIEYQIFDDYQINICELSELSKVISFERVEDTLKYKITGIITDDSFLVGGIAFKDDYLIREYGYLRGKLITLLVDRIDVNVISESDIK